MYVYWIFSIYFNFSYWSIHLFHQSENAKPTVMFLLYNSVITGNYNFNRQIKNKCNIFLQFNRIKSLHSIYKIYKFIVIWSYLSQSCWRKQNEYHFAKRFSYIDCKKCFYVNVCWKRPLFHVCIKHVLLNLYPKRFYLYVWNVDIRGVENGRTNSPP